MKKNLALVLVLALVMAVSVVAFAACGGQTYEGSYDYKALKYENGKPVGVDDANSYGCKVKVTVNNGTITKVVVVADTEHYYNLSAGWKDKETGEDTAGKKAWLEKGQAMAESFVGLKVEDVLAINVAKVAETNLEYHQPAGQPTGITGAPSELKVVTGATQSSGRLILAVQNALGKIPAAK